jgi:hypothetical protein
MQEMKTNGIDLNTESYVAIIQAFEDDRHFHGVLQFVDSMKAEGLVVSEEIYRHLLIVALKDAKDYRNFEYVLKVVDDLGYVNHPRIVDVLLKYKIVKFGMDEAKTMVTQLLELQDYDDETKSRLLCTLLHGFLSKKDYDMVLHYLEFMGSKGTLKQTQNRIEDLQKGISYSYGLSVSNGKARRSSKSFGRNERERDGT